MSNIVLKTHSTTKTVGQIALTQGVATKVKAQKGVNYELVDQQTGRAPDHIITKRVGKDLHISLDKDGQSDDLIIEDYYDHGDAALIGLAEDGQYYYYIPDTGEAVDYVTQLVTGDVEGQALGGGAVSTPWWIGATETKAAIWPWLTGGLLAAGAVGIVAASVDGVADSLEKDTTFTPKTGANDITITVAGDDVVNKAEADKATVPVAVKVAPKDGETVTGVKVTINNKEYPAEKAANGDYVAQVTPADIKADQDKHADAKVTLSKDGKTGTVTDKEAYTVDTDAPKVKGTPAVDGAGTTLTVTFDEPLDAANPPAKENFKVKVGDKTVTPTNVTVEGDKVKLTLPEPAKQGDTVKVSYNDPSTANDPKAVQDKAGNDAASFTDTDVTNGSKVAPADTTPPTASISVTGDKGKTTVAAPNDKTIEAAATTEDDNPNTGLTYTVTLDKPADSEKKVKVKLSGAADADDIQNITGVGGATVTHNKTDNTVTVTIPKGESSAGFLLNPKLEPLNNNQYNYGGQESVVATVQQGAGYKVDGNKGSATGIILDGHPVALRQLDGDLTLYYGLQKDLAATDKDHSHTVAVDTHDNPVQSPILMTDFADRLYVGYFSDGTPTKFNGNIANSQDYGPANATTDNKPSITTVDMGAGNDLLWVRGDQLQATRVYLGEGNDTYTLGGRIFSSLNEPQTSANIFAEAGNDTVEIGGAVSQANIYMGSGSDILTIKGNLAFTNVIDMGSGQGIDTDLYQPTYKANGKSLGNDNNTDKPSDVNHLNIEGSISGNTTILGGAGKDHVNLKTGNHSLSLSQLTDVDVINLNGTGKNTLKDVNVANVAKNQNLYIQGGSDDTVDIGHSGPIKKYGESPRDPSPWEVTSTEKVDGHTYDVWTHDNGNGGVSTVYIEQGINVI
ncbi:MULTISPECIES: SwmB domain-containing protein [Moraxella]|uniref:Uncharacterized protein n=1 Tax=Moraxella catarrhalis TaxID=480 RepID=A0A7Z0UZJ9_MORCA|nr:SwmB domain-containing protein [Moraxella catarrhalis]OAV01707.1 hypothetical protein AO382_0073 [Moraxella catarrhalis]STY82349.1 cyanobacterial long protein repeat [Moraxella catarrhalis]